MYFSSTGEMLDAIGKDNGPYFGRHFSDLELDAKTLELIPGRFREGEAQLYKSKHADYRAIHPMAATMLFAQAYIEAYKWTARKREDFRVVDTMKIFSNSNPMFDTEQNRVGLWQARRAADGLGVRYDKFCFYALDYSELAGWKRLAMPRELANQNVIEAIINKMAVFV